MQILLDTHTLLWFLDNDKKLSRRAVNTIEARKHQIFVSDISFFEISIKVNIGKLQMKLDLRSLIDLASQNFCCLPLSHEHIITYQDITCRGFHRDPFDRMLIAVARHEQMALMTNDEKFAHYKDFIKLFW